MLRHVRKLVWPHRERVLALVMLPAFVLATLPNTACICGDGHRESSCNVAACLAIKQGKSTGVCCGCSCCQSKTGKPCCCCNAQQSPSQSENCPLPGLAAKTGNCCRPIIEAPAPIKGIEKASLSEQLDIAVSVEFAITASVEQPPVVRRTLDYHGPPPLDAVIVFLHLTI